ncbi:MAG: 50S ribosomal protein L32e [Candidatus Thermoplasmatota archaeon]|nr:50S ribosomal protein L32e [Candidatus Thermoplasmatota archaeon]
MSKRFKRQEWFRYKRLGTSWRRPKGHHSKMREHKGYRQDVVSIGYRKKRAERGLHPCGLREVLVSNPKELEDIDPRMEVARIKGSVGNRKRVEIVNIAKEKGIKVLNAGGVEPREKITEPEEKITEPEEKITEPEEKITEPEEKITEPEEEPQEEEKEDAE